MLLPSAAESDISQPITMAFPTPVAAILKKMRMKVRVPNPFTHLLFLTILVGPDLRNLAIPNEAVVPVSDNVTQKRDDLISIILLSLLTSKPPSANESVNSIYNCGTDSKNGSETKDRKLSSRQIHFIIFSAYLNERFHHQTPPSLPSIWGPSLFWHNRAL